MGSKKQRVFILFDYDDKPIRASVNGRKLYEECNELNGCDDWPYYVVDLELEGLATRKEGE